MKTPDWYRQAVAEHGAHVLDGTKTRAEASAAVAALIQAHPEHVADLAAGEADRDIARWVRERQSNGDLFQTALFPMLPVSMQTTPSRTAAVSGMTARDLDNARAMLWNRTENQMNGAKDAAERERSAFDEFYGTVRPLLTGGKTVADVIADLTAKADVQHNAA
jgi:hypothetical protein